MEDYQAGRKGPTNPMAAATGGLFGSAAPATSTAATGLFGSAAANTGFFGQAKTGFGASEWFESSYCNRCNPVTLRLQLGLGCAVFWSVHVRAQTKTQHILNPTGNWSYQLGCANW